MAIFLQNAYCEVVFFWTEEKFLKIDHFASSVKVHIAWTWEAKHTFSGIGFILFIYLLNFYFTNKV